MWPREQLTIDQAGEAGGLEAGRKLVEEHLLERAELQDVSWCCFNLERVDIRRVSGLRRVRWVRRGRTSLETFSIDARRGCEAYLAR